MRLSKFALIAAAGLGALSLNAAITKNGGAFVGGTDSNVRATDSYNMTATTDVLTLNIGQNLTYSGVVGGVGTLQKSGEGVLQIDTFSQELGANYYEARTWVGAAIPPNLMGANSTGGLVVTQGEVIVSGYLTAWRDQPVVGSTPFSGYQGFSSVTLTGDGSRLAFANSRTNVLRVVPNFDGEPDPRSSSTDGFKLNFVRDLYGAANTELGVGVDDRSVLLVQTANTRDNGIGIIDGKGVLIVGGIGNFRVQNDSRFTGDVQLLGGTMTLESATGNSLATAESFTFGSRSGAGRSWLILNESVSIPNRGVESKPEYAPSYSQLGGQDAVLTISNGTQVIRNFQKRFNDRTALPMPESVNDEFLYDFSNGSGSTIVFSTASDKLELRQSFDAVYNGNIGGGGTLIKSGSAKLALTGSSSSGTAIEIREGTLISNVQMLGTGAVVISSGATLDLVQNDAGTLSALITGNASSELRFSTDSTVTDYRGATLTVASVVNKVDAFGKALIGSVNIARAQTGFTGGVIASDGLTLTFTDVSGDAFVNASSFTLLAAAGATTTATTTLDFGNTNQTLRNFQGEAATRINLGRGTATLIQNLDTVYAGEIFGAGSLIKEGSGIFGIAGRNGAGDSSTLYFGATVVNAGTLAFGGVNQTPNSSALVVTGGSASFNGSQTFGALYGGASSTLSLGGDTLTVGLTAAQRNARLNVVTVGGGQGAGYYLPTDDAGIAGYDRAATLAYLRNTAGLTGTDDEVLSFAGTITGTGGLIKIGTETLSLTGVNTYTGATQILGGVLRADYDALSGTSGVAIAAPATLEINAALGETGTFTGTLSGAGAFHKVGLGEVTLAGNTTAYTGTLTVEEGLLRFNAEGTSPGTVVVNSGATLALNTPTSGLTTTYTGPITSSGILQKEGAGTLKLTNLTNLPGSSFNILGGTLAVGNLPTGSGDIAIASGATFETATSAPTTFSGDLSGAGTFRVSGTSSLTLDLTPLPPVVPPFRFTGVVEVAEQAVLVLQPGKNNVLMGASIVLKDDGVLDISGTTQTFTGLSSDSATALLQLGNGTLNFNVDTGVTTIFAGNLVGGPDDPNAGTLNKQGAGTLSLRGITAGVVKFDVTAGTLEATPAALGAGNDVHVFSGATFAVRNDSGTPLVFQNVDLTLDAGATFAKTGVGEVQFDGVGGSPGALTHVFEGTLTVDAPLASVFTGVTVDAGATLKVNVSGGVTHGDSAPNSIAGAGDLAAYGTGTLTLNGTQTYTGNTVLGAGVTLQFTGTTAMNGLAGEVGSTVEVPGALTINQLRDGVFNGTFSGAGDVTVTGTAVLTLANSATGTVPGALTVDGGKLEVSATNTTTITLQNSGSLYVNVTGVNEVYQGDVTATGTGNNFIKTGSGSIDLAGSLANIAGFSGSVGVAEGVLSIDPTALPPSVTGLVTESTATRTGTLQLNVSQVNDPATVAYEGATLALPVTGNGILEKTGAGELRVNGPQLAGFTGTLLVSQGRLGGNFTTGGNLVVGSGGTLAAGNSPGTIVVAGDFNLNVGGTLEVEINATTSDKVVVTGSATLAGALVVKQDNTPGSTKSAPGTSYSILTAAGGITGTFSNEVNGVVQLAAADVAATGISRVRLTRNVGATDLTMTTVGAVSLIGGLHDGLGGLVSAIDAGTLPPAVLAAVDSAVLGGNAAPVVNNLSPLGYAAEYAMAQDADNRLHAGLHDRLEQRRYDRASTLTLDEAPWEAFASATGSFADNKQATDTPTFNYRTFGGVVGLDKKVSDDLTVGAAVAYDNGSADIHDNGGKIEMSRATLTLFGGTQITSRWYVDGGLTGGYAKFDGKRRTALGELKGSNDGLSVGGFIETGTIFAVTKDFHITPYAGVAYTHHEFDGVTESGNASALKTESWSNDSLRAKIGSGFGWFIPMADWKLKLGLDAAFAHELIDTDSDIEASFASGGSKFTTTAAALPQSSVGLTPSIGVEFDETLSASVGYSYEMGFDGRSYQSINFSVRKRF